MNIVVSRAITIVTVYSIDADIDTVGWDNDIIATITILDLQDYDSDYEFLDEIRAILNRTTITGELRWLGYIYYNGQIQTVPVLRNIGELICSLPLPSLEDQ